MEKASRIYSSGLYLALWPLIVATVLIVSAPYLPNVDIHAEPVFEKPVASKQETGSKNEHVQQSLQAQTKPGPTALNLQKKHTLTVPRSSTSSASGKKDGYLFHPIIVQAAERYQVDADLIRAIIMAESGYNPKAVSRRGAKGLMQLMPRTAKALGVKDCFSPEHNINGGVRYFKQLLNRFDGDVRLALAAYNAGSRNVRQYKGMPPFKATHYYVKKVFEYYEYYKKQSEQETESA
jgi:soluble lytic murein transglycosylase-like protein